MTFDTSPQTFPGIQEAKVNVLVSICRLQWYFGVKRLDYDLLQRVLIISPLLLTLSAVCVGRVVGPCCM